MALYDPAYFPGHLPIKITAIIVTRTFHENTAAAAKNTAHQPLFSIKTPPLGPKINRI